MVTARLDDRHLCYSCHASRATTLAREPAPQKVKVNLPEDKYFVRVSIERVQQLKDGCTEACVIKDAGDDPDVTHGSRIGVQLKAEGTGIRFSAGIGVGTITK